MNPILPGLVAIMLYLLSTGLLFQRLGHAAGGSAVRRSHVLVTGLAACVLHVVMLYPVLLTGAGLNLGFFQAASLIALTTALLLSLAAFYEPVENLGIPVFPLAAASIGLLVLFPGEHLVTGPQLDKALDFHILTSLLAYSILGLAALQAVVLAIQDHHLHNRQPGGFIRALPPLQTMETLLFQMIGGGFMLLTLALVTGFIFLEDIFAQHLVHKTVLSIAAWLVFAVLIWGRWRFGWRGRNAIRWTIGGFIFLMLAYFGSKFVLELVLN